MNATPAKARPGRLLAGRLHQTQTKRLILSRQGRPYRITFAGLKAVRAQLDNR
ncbi:YjhX family toxin [Serratia marcescens]|uniref:YjhX family toxin n=1 Tax=Serratia marcescens TaxID=615 RepID=UPI0038BC8B08